MSSAPLPQQHTHSHPSNVSSPLLFLVLGLSSLPSSSSSSSSSCWVSPPSSISHLGPSKIEPFLKISSLHTISQDMGSSSNVPLWLEALLSESFFQRCPTHESPKKKDRNMLCLQCCSPFCLQCMEPHRSHRFLRVRRYMYRDVVRLEDLDGLIDCASIQTYLTNGAKVVFVHERQHTVARPMRVSNSTCVTCSRILQDPYSFCSLSCKVSHRSTCRWDCEWELEDGQLTPVSVLESPGGSVGSVTSTSGWTEGIVRGRKRSIGCAAEMRPTWRCGGESARSRKARPCRSPLC